METLEPTIQGFSGDDSKSSDPGQSLMIEASWQRERQDLHLNSWVRPQRIATGCRMSVRLSHITSPSGDMKAI